MLWMILSVLFAQTPPPPPPPQSPRAPVVPMPRDAGPPKSGTGVIGGRVVTGDSGAPVRRVIVTLVSQMPIVQASPDSPGNQRRVVTDADGRFQFADLPAGSYRLRASPPQHQPAYLGSAYGGRRQWDSGRAIALKEAERFQNATIALPRGGVIVGRVIDDGGEPAARVSVFAARWLPGSAQVERASGYLQTDDLGRFRVFGLEPGEYYVAAEGRNLGGGPTEGESDGFLTTYYPSAAAEAQAARVRVAAGAETGVVEIQLVRTRLFRISGMVVDSQGRPTPAQPMLVRKTFGEGYSSSSISLDGSGKFVARELMPGDYRLVVRPTLSGPSSFGYTGPPGQKEFASLPITVAGDMDDIVLMTQPGISITGQVVFAEGAPTAPPSGIRIVTQSQERAMLFGFAPTAVVGASMEFTLPDVFGPMLIRPMNLPSGYAVKAVMLGSSEITDTPTVFRAEDNNRLQVILTSRVASLEGTVSGDTGEPIEGAALVFPEERSAWAHAIRTHQFPVTSGGRFTVTGLLPGTYYAVAISRDSGAVSGNMRAEYYEALSKIATKVVLAEGEKRTIDLRIMALPEDR